MPWKAHQLARQTEQLQHLWLVHIDVARLRALFIDETVRIPAQISRALCCQLAVIAQHLSQITQRTAWPVTDNRRCECCALTAILAVDVLDDFFAALVFKIDIDVGRLSTFARDKALEQHLHAYRIDRRDTEAITNDRVGCRTTSLTQNADAACVLHDVMHRQKKRLVS